MYTSACARMRCKRQERERKGWREEYKKLTERKIERNGNRHGEKKNREGKGKGRRGEKETKREREAKAGASERARERERE
eukprot:6175399-Pleurochrysis_carterae.AAC.5